MILVEKDFSSYGLDTLGPLCLWQCFFLKVKSLTRAMISIATCLFIVIVFVIVIVIVIVFVFCLMRSSLLKTPIKCIKGLRFLGSLFQAVFKMIFVFVSFGWSGNISPSLWWNIPKIASLLGRSLSLRVFSEGKVQTNKPCYIFCDIFTI